MPDSWVIEIWLVVLCSSQGPLDAVGVEAAATGLLAPLPGMALGLDSAWYEPPMAFFSLSVSAEKDVRG